MRYIILIILFMFSLSSFAQYGDGVDDGIEFLNEKTFKHKVDNSREITVVEFYAVWNAYNQCGYLKELKDCDVYRVNIDEQPGLAKTYGVKVVPTLIIFDGGEVKAKYEANLMFQAEGKFSYEGVQEKLESIILEKFQ